MRKDVNDAKNTDDKVRAISSPENSCRIIGIGTSAGGLETLELFLRHVPVDCGLGFVIVQHLDPNHEGMLADLLQKATPMKVVEVSDRTRVRPNFVYVIPPNKYLTIVEGTVHLSDPIETRGPNLPIDVFFRSLALDQQSRSVGVILSGLGTDGTLGFKAIKESGGLTFVQDPATAKFDGMPRSVVDSNVSDVQAVVEELPARIIEVLRMAPTTAQLTTPELDTDIGALQKVIILLRARTGHDFSLYKTNTLFRRIERRMGIHQISSIGNYVQYLRDNSNELDLLFKELLIGVTSFFRDPDVWEQLKTEVLPGLLKDHPATEPLRVWIPACSTGEDAFSLAIIFREVLEQQKGKYNAKIQIFATDLDSDAIERARVGRYSEAIEAEISAERLSRFFTKSETHYVVNRSIRESVTFAVQNVISDPPFTKLDLLICRNLLIYLMPELQTNLFHLFHYSLKPGGYLLLGSAETIGNLKELFSPILEKHRMYRRVQTGPRLATATFPTTIGRLPSVKAKSVRNPNTLKIEAEQLLLQRYSPAAVLVNEGGDILFINGRTGKYLEPAAGKANWNIFAMAREGLRFVLASAFQKAVMQKEPVFCRDVQIASDSSTLSIDVTVQHISNSGVLNGLIMVVIVEKSQSIGASARNKATSKRRGAAELDEELANVRALLNAVQMEKQQFQEEAQSANEELQSMNEELQSTNEELTTSKEELQSINEELQTLNHELLGKVDDMNNLNNDLRNLLECTEIATIFLDRLLQVRLFTAGSCKIFKFRPSDVGRPITDIASDLDYAELAEDAQTVQRTLIPHEYQASTRDGRWFLVRIVPYRTLDNVIDGVSIILTNVTASKNLELALSASQSDLETRETARDLEPKEDPTGPIDNLQKQSPESTGIRPENIAAKGVGNEHSP